ncbi:MAG TPA: SDR family oxidoreductase [Steroidobacteraceae bacterium]|jgi:short-subunit dehydrogenase|nr:SDR family oxidoreductase [Steroidobacteraceae bacterium]
MGPGRPGAGQSALVTGASMGIGVDLAECLARDGYDLILAARSEAALNAVAGRLSAAHGVKAAVFAVDLGEHGGGTRLAQAVSAAGLKVDVLVNNAGFGKAGVFAGSEIGPQLGMIDLDVRALVELTHIYWPEMLAQNRGGVLNVASMAAFVPGPLMAVYYASKAFVLSFSEALWEEARGTGVHVSCLCPGATKSKFRERAGTGSTRLGQTAVVMESMPVAEAGYAGLRNNQRVVITGKGNHRTVWMVPFLPRTVVLKMVRNIQSPASTGK